MTVAVNDFAAYAAALDSPPRHFKAVTPDDANDLPHVSRGISFAVAGDLKLTSLGGETDVIPSGALSAGVIHPGFYTRVWATGTGATGIVVYW